MLPVSLFTVLAAGAIALLLYQIIARKYRYFLSKPVPFVKPTLLLGSSGPILFRRSDSMSWMKAIYNTFPDSRVIGFYSLMKPTYLIRDPDLIKQIAIKDFEYFADHSPELTSTREDDRSSPEDKNLIAQSLFGLRGQKWKDMRSTLSPAFTGSKMRRMFDLVANCGKSMTDFFLSEAEKGHRLEYDMKNVCTRFANDVIASVAFGIPVDSFRNPNNEFYLNGKDMFNFSSPMKIFKIFLMFFVPYKLRKKFNLDFFDNRITDYFMQIIMDTMKQREEKNIVQHDMIQMLMMARRGSLKHAKNEEDVKDAGFATVEESSIGKTENSRVWTKHELVAQCFLFFVAGLDTVSTVMSFLVYELTINPDIQQRLYEEVLETDQNLDGKPLTYEILQKMQYMDMVVSEGLRLWPPNVMSDRYCVKNYELDCGPGKKFIIEKGTTVWFPTAPIHHNPQYYPNPMKFDPERFSVENRSQIKPEIYLPFGIGPRNCIGSRLALMEIKSGVYHLLRKFSLEPTEKTQIPLRLAKHLMAVQAEKGVWVELKPRQ
ncbi:probable cytochrome P450 9f2 [Sabethes cyaneus]|uniref:probable cytochrome P450 9f2 n=1 Tax=Sabethes cyaneus TaxID=53552 RepID=UPI00237D6E13|nr:probable cytochrome P450 9f2 [Sabethes cyaneus]